MTTTDCLGDDDALIRPVADLLAFRLIPFDDNDPDGGVFDPVPAPESYEQEDRNA